MSAKSASEIGKNMWFMLDETFQHVARENGLTNATERAHLWAGFLAAAAGCMLADIGKTDAVTVLAGVRLGVEKVAAEALKGSH